MIRIFTLIFGLSLVGPSFGNWEPASGVGWESFDLIAYSLECQQEGCVLVSDADQRWNYLFNTSNAIYSQNVRERAIANCKALSKKPLTCRVVDEHLESDFIRNFSNSSEQIATNPDTTKTVQPLAVAEAQPTEADKNIETDGDNIVYHECYSLVHSGFTTPGSQAWQISWKDIVTDSPVAASGGPRYDMEVNKILSMCEPFLSEDLLAWTAPLPDELEACQAIADNPKSCMFQAGSKTITSEQIATNPDTTKTVQPLAVAEAQPTEADKNIETDGDVAPDASISAMLPSPTPSVAAEIEQAPAVAEAQPTEADKKLELEFWQSIKGSDDPDMYREYLRQFPSGVYAGLVKIVLKKFDSDARTAGPSIPDLKYGDYYALVIGNNNYTDLNNLRSAVSDARVVSKVLEVDYGFNVKLLEDASRKDILRGLKSLRESVGAQDNVLIYYAGHGYLDEAADEGYWLPVDSERDDDSNWIPTDRVASQVKAMKAKHVMVVADSCFSGTITRAIKIDQRTPQWLSEIVNKKARTALTSGGLEPVMDTGSGNHSAFAHAFISLLEENEGVLDASQLFSQLRPKVMVNSNQTPQYGKIHMAGDDGGDFLFVRQ